MSSQPPSTAPPSTAPPSTAPPSAPATGAPPANKPPWYVIAWNFVYRQFNSKKPKLIAFVVRAALWVMAIVIAVMPAIMASNITPSWSLDVLVRRVNDAGHFKDLFYVTIVTAVLGLGNVIDHIYRSKGRLGELSWVCFIVLITTFVVISVYSVYRFVAISRTDSLNLEVLNHDYDIIVYTLWAGFVTELLIALREPSNADLGSSPTPAGAH